MTGFFEEKESGATTDREQLKNMMEIIQPGDLIIVVDLTRITRSTKDLFQLIEDIKDNGASLKSLKDTWLDTSDDNPYSAFLLTIFAGMNQLERDLIKSRQKEGIAICKGKREVRILTKKQLSVFQIDHTLIVLWNLRTLKHISGVTH